VVKLSSSDVSLPEIADHTESAVRLATLLRQAAGVA